MMVRRLWTYQSERFPLLSHGALIATFSVSALAFSAWSRHATFPPAVALLAGFVSSLIFFAQLRIADEWKDAREDALYRPYRPVPRGLVTLRELAWIGVGGAAVQLAIALFMSPHVLPLLFAVWLLFALMSREFFAGRWLRAHPLVYMCSHMLIMPLIDLYVSSFDWLRAGSAPSIALTLFLAVTFCNGMVLEIGRKIRAPQDEEAGVETYSALWGKRRALWAWAASLAATALIAVLTSVAVHAYVVMAAAALCAVPVAFTFSVFFIRTTSRNVAASVQALSGIWTVALYASLGIAPFIGRFA